MATTAGPLSLTMLSAPRPGALLMATIVSLIAARLQQQPREKTTYFFAGACGLRARARSRAMSHCCGNEATFCAAQ